MNTIIDEIKKYGDEFEKATGSKIPLKIRSNNYKELWDAIASDEEYLMKMAQLVVDKEGKISFASNRIAGIVFMNADSSSVAFESFKIPMMLNRSRIKTLGLKKMDEYEPYNLLTLLLKRDDANISIATKQRIISVAELYEGSKGYLRVLNKISLMLSDSEFKSVLCLDKDGTKTLAKQVVDINSKDLKDAFRDAKSPITNYRDLRYYILKNGQFRSQFSELVCDLYHDKSIYTRFIYDISMHIAKRLEIFGFNLCSHEEILNNVTEIAGVLRNYPTPQVLEIISDIELLEKMLKVMPFELTPALYMKCEDD